MGIFDEFKQLIHPYEDEDEDDYDDFDLSPRPVERRDRDRDRYDRPARSSESSYSAPSSEEERRGNKVVNIRAPPNAT